MIEFMRGGSIGEGGAGRMCCGGVCLKKQRMISRETAGEIINL